MASLGYYLLLAAFVVAAYAAGMAVAGARRRSTALVESGVGGKASNPDRGTVDKVWIIPGCIVCDACEDASPDVFHVTDTTSVIKMESQPNWTNLSESIADAAAACPVNVIKYEIKK